MAKELDMSFLDRILKGLTGGRGPGGQSSSANARWVYVQCNRCGEPLRGRVNLETELSLEEDDDSYVVRKGLVGSGKLRCFQTIEVTLKFDANKQETGREVSSGRFITAEEYQALIANWPPPEEEEENA
jgi:hypothetical protein